ncbi:major facilitator superfamily transporter [Diplodia corticola]|uniref:Major facilitator superfamily transporter n=1 Tax=Diplodia corticola TaxID=236234 RepID=A0A1J9RFL5_9PEZI|nr:major facilitator superfamily transporter [Diplodia corticola]OJD40326.1 major facilitator superfamily transporter [Diplodia corticola]
MAEHKLPWRQFVILSLCRFAEPIALTSVFPYLPEMIESFGVPKNEIAKWAGAASAIFSLGQCLTSIFWGRASDKYGRKRIILLGLTNTMLTSLLWGFSTSLPMALTARAIQGAGNGNVGILRTMVAELCPWKELQPRAFSIMPLIYNIGSVFGPAIGGALSNPLGVDVSKPRGDSFFEKFPFALPNIVGSLLFLTGIITGILFLHETLETKKDETDYGLILGEKLESAFNNQIVRAKNVWHRAKGEETEPLLKHADSSMSNQDGDEDQTNDDPRNRAEQKHVTIREVLTVQSVTNLVIYTVLAMHSIGYDQLLPVFMHHPAHPRDGSSYDPANPLKFSNGFGIKSKNIGTMFTLYGALCFLFQLFFFPPLARRFGVLRCFRVVSLIFPVVFLITPFTALLPDQTSQQVVLFLIMTVKGCCTTFAFPCSTILLTNSASSLRVLGTLNGIATSVSAIGRASGPAVGGSLFTLGVKHGYVIAPFWMFTAISLIGAVPAFLLVEGKGFGPDDEDEDEESSGDEDSVAAKAAGRQSAAGARGLDGGDEENNDRVGDLLSRTTTFSSIASAAISDEDEDEDGTNGYPISASLPAEAPHRPPRVSRAPSTVRRRTSVPIGMGGNGLRRYSSNLGVTRDGYGTGQSWGG